MSLEIAIVIQDALEVLRLYLFLPTSAFLGDALYTSFTWIYFHDY